ncbi:hypothetical protein [Massilia cavernae]|uniref:Acyl carrier protein n=1 Tax=Massilia cavernae TaxID=2320864 RepID=A0A418XGW4_9BURK|nr:hypothetical protein [Massilia cavernae]RJG11708.1 hypothetical protein D3872_18230 [Massilia cavernae]
MKELESKIKEALDDFWEDRAIPTSDGGSIVDVLVAPVESMTAVEVLIELDKITGVKIPNTVIQAGGYMTKEEFIEKLTAAVVKHLKRKS